MKKILYRQLEISTSILKSHDMNWEYILNKITN